jgi:AraC-like DNA-binding protein
MATGPRCRFVGRLVVRTPWRREAHAHDFAEAIVVRGGSMVVTSDGRRLTSSAGDVFVYPPGFSHSERVKGGAPLDILFFGFRDRVRSRPLSAHDHSGRLRVISEWLLQEQRTSHARKQRTMDGLLAAFLAEFEKAAAPRPDTLVESTREYVREHLSQRLRVEELAAHAGMSRAHFIRAFRRAAGRPPMADVRLQRAEAARELIVTTDLPLKAIAPQVGLADEFHLSRTVRRVLGVPPGYFRGRA